MVAVAEHEANIEIYTTVPTFLNHLDVGADYWHVTEFIPYKGEWRECDREFIKHCIARTIG